MIIFDFRTRKRNFLHWIQAVWAASPSILPDRPILLLPNLVTRYYIANLAPGKRTEEVVRKRWQTNSSKSKHL
jgi:hypothetical protein